MSALLSPLHENLKQMKEAVEKSDHDQTVLMSRLDASIQENLKQAHEVGQRADKLAEALTGENKTQGNFGELRLRTLLEQMGLEEGVQFEEQVTLKDEQGRTVHEEDGHKMIPDVILHFPDNRDVIIDAKMSLKAFEDYHNATTDTECDEALQRHLTSVRSHVKELARKKYAKYAANGKVQLDFVVMYVYSESALQLALTNDPALWKDAYDQGVIISGSQNLYMMLRVLEMTWRQVRQAENQDAMLKAADTGQNFWVVFGLALGLFALVQVISDMVVTPHIMGKALGLNPAILLLSLSVWGAILGFIGLIVALPLTTLLITYWKKYVTKEESVGRLKAKAVTQQPTEPGGPTAEA